MEQWIACDLRYVAEAKLSRLTEDELAKLYFGIGKKHGLSITSVSADRDVMIEKLMQMKKEIHVAYSAAVAMEKAHTAAEATKVVESIFETGPEGEGEDVKEGEEGKEGPGRGTDRADGGGARRQAGSRGARGGLDPARGRHSGGPQARAAAG